MSVCQREPRASLPRAPGGLPAVLLSPSSARAGQGRRLSGDGPDLRGRPQRGERSENPQNRESSRCYFKNLFRIHPVFLRWSSRESVGRRWLRPSEPAAVKTGEGGLISPSWGHFAAWLSTVAQTSLENLLIAIGFAKILYLLLLMGFCFIRRLYAGRAFDGSWGVGVVPPLESLGFTRFCGCEIFFFYVLRWMEIKPDL